MGENAPHPSTRCCTPTHPPPSPRPCAGVYRGIGASRAVDTILAIRRGICQRRLQRWHETEHRRARVKHGGFDAFATTRVPVRSRAFSGEELTWRGTSAITGKLTLAAALCGFRRRLRCEANSRPRLFGPSQHAKERRRVEVVQIAVRRYVGPSLTIWISRPNKLGRPQPTNSGLRGNNGIDDWRGIREQQREKEHFATLRRVRNVGKWVDSSHIACYPALASVAE